MSSEKTILIVDDTRSAVRAILQDLPDRFRVVTVPSAEEGMLELAPARCHLLIANVQLPGMGGLELVRRARKRRPDLPVFLFAKRLSSADRRQGDELGVTGYFSQPLERVEVITAVSDALDSPINTTPPDPSLPLTLIQNQLSTLKGDTSATGVMFVDMNGVILTQDTERIAGHDLPQIASRLQKTMDNSLELADGVGSETSFTLHYQMLDALKLYCANVGRRYFLVLFFTTMSQVGGISMVSVFTQRAIKNLLTLLNDADSSGKLLETSELIGQDVASGMAEQRDEEQAAVLSPQAETVEQAVSAESLSEAEMAQLLALDFSAVPDEADLNALWSQSDDADNVEGGKGLSLAEAMKQGLVPSDFDED